MHAVWIEAMLGARPNAKAFPRAGFSTPVTSLTRLWRSLGSSANVCDSNASVVVLGIGIAMLTGEILP